MSGLMNYLEICLCLVSISTINDPICVNTSHYNLQTSMLRFTIHDPPAYLEKYRDREARPITISPMRYKPPICSRLDKMTTSDIL